MLAAIFTIGLLLIVSAVKNTQHELGQQLQTDMLGQDGFMAWAGAILAIGAIGYVPGLRLTSRYLLALLAVVLIVRNGAVFAAAQTAITNASTAGPAPAIPTKPISLSGGSGGSSGGSGGSGSGSASSGSSGGIDTASIAEDAALLALV